MICRLARHARPGPEERVWAVNRLYAWGRPLRESCPACGDTAGPSHGVRVSTAWCGACPRRRRSPYRRAGRGSMPPAPTGHTGCLGQPYQTGPNYNPTRRASLERQLDAAPAQVAPHQSALPASCAAHRAAPTRRALPACQGWPRERWRGAPASRCSHGRSECCTARGSRAQWSVASPPASNRRKPSPIGYSDPQREACNSTIEDVWGYIHGPSYFRLT